MIDAKSDQATTSSRAAAPMPGRLALIAMSALLVWHTTAMVIGPSPPSVITDAARVVFDPYMTLLRLDNVWGFFAPNVNRGSNFSYVIEDAEGKTTTFTPSDSLNRYHPTYIWMRDRYSKVLEQPDVYGDITGAQFCLEHASLKPVKVMLVRRSLKPFGADDWLEGDTPISPAFMTEKTVRTVTCPGR